VSSAKAGEKGQTLEGLGRKSMAHCRGTHRFFIDAIIRDAKI